MTAPPDSASPSPQQMIAELQRKLDEARAELVSRNSAYSERIVYQTATNDVMKVMAASPGDPQPVFDLISVRARDICDAYGVTVHEFDGSLIHWRAATGVSEEPAVREAAKAAFPRPPAPDLPVGRAILNRGIVHIRDLDAEPGVRRFSFTVKSTVVVPMLRMGVPIGALQMGSRERGGFSDGQVELLVTFADQAVIAIENARLFNEVQAKTRDLEEALVHQTGSANILKVIASSPTEVGPFLTAIVENACSICEAENALVALKEDDDLVFQTQHGSPPVIWKRQSINRRWVTGRAVVDHRPVHLHDYLAPEGDEFPDGRELALRDGARTVLAVPLMRESECIGVIGLRRMEVRPFSDRQIGLLQTFADQAVIAIGNVWLFEEVQQRTRELSESLDQQVATSEVLQVISSSPGELEPVFQSMLANASRLCEAACGVMWLREGDHFRSAAIHGPLPPAYVEQWKSGTPVRPDPHGPLTILAQTRKTVHVSDMRDDRSYYLSRHPLPVAAVDVAGIRTLLLVPMSKEDDLVGGIAVYRQEVRPFTDKQIALVQNFAAQAVIAIENARLLNELRQRTSDLSKSLDDLRAAQDRLVQTEKLASLGQLTAGIAHEIKNPLNFVNNFSGMSAELIGELQDIVSGLSIDPGTHADIKELTEMLSANLGKIVQHGKRADAIVKSMLLHSGQSSGEHRPSDVNAIVDECLNRAYYGERAETRGFAIKLEKSFDPDVGEVDLFPREISRAILNLISNGFYATSKRKEADGAGYEPVLIAATRNLGDRVEIRIRDNGSGISPDVREKMFDPFFTTKPAGEGTGLGLSITHDIIVKQHGGSIEVDSKPDQFAEIRLVLPRAGALFSGRK